MSRRTTRAVEAAAAEASEAARTLAARSHEARTEKVEPTPEPKPKSERSADPGRIEKLLDARTHVQAMEEIVEKRGLNKEEKAPKAEEPPKEPAKEEPQAVEPVVEAAPPVETAVEAPEAPKLVKQKVDGVEYEVSQTEIDEAGGERAWRKDKAAENRLAKAAEANKQTQAHVAHLAQLLIQQNTPKKEAGPSEEKFIQDKIDVIRFGTPAESAVALREIVQRAIPKPVDQNAFFGQIMDAIKRENAIADFGKEFPEVVSNELLVKLSMSLEREEIAKAQRAGQPVDWRNFYRTIGNQVRSVVPARQSQSAPTPKDAGNPSPSSEKEARKASITTIPTAAARAALPAEEKELTPEEERKAWIADQKKARGQA